MKINKIISYFLIILIIFISACDQSKSFDDIELIAIRQFGQQKISQQKTPDQINIAIDVSESMKGFSQTGSFQELISKTVHALGPIAKVNFYWFDTTFGKIPDFINFFNPNFFNGYATNFQKAFSIRNKDANEILILLTDLQFNNERAYHSLVRAFQLEIYNGGYIKIFSATPDFNGIIFPQFSTKSKFSYKGERPLYAICIGERSNSMFIEEVLRKTIPWKHSVTLSSGIPLEWKLFRPSRSVRIQGKNLSMISTDSLTFKLKFVSPVISDWGEWTQDEIIINTYSFVDSNFVESNEKLILRDLQTNNDTCTFTLFSEQINPNPPKLFRISLRPNAVPPWIVDFSCTPDGDQAKKTVKLKEFIEDVIRPVINPFTVNSINIFLKQD